MSNNTQNLLKIMHSVYSPTFHLMQHPYITQQEYLYLHEETFVWSEDR